MERMSRRRLSVTALVVVSMAGLAAGLLLATGSGAEPAAKGRPGVLASGRFTSIEWPTSGRAKIVRIADLRSVTGDQDYSLPADVARNPHQAVIIWCGSCNKAWGSAHLRPNRQTS